MADLILFSTLVGSGTMRLDQYNRYRSFGSSKVFGAKKKKNG